MSRAVHRRRRGMWPQVLAGMLTINTQPMKIALLHHTNACINALLGFVEARQRASNKEIAARFEAQQRLILRESQSTEECLQLAKDIAAAGAQLDALTAALEVNKRVDEFLHDYRCCCFPQSYALCRRCQNWGCKRACSKADIAPCFIARVGLVHLA